MMNIEKQTYIHITKTKEWTALYASELINIFKLTCLSIAHNLSDIFDIGYSR